MKYFFTSDEHYGHNNIIKYCKRPFNNVDEMNHTLIQRHNKVVGPNDTVIHCGDFTLTSDYTYVYDNYVNRLSGNHIFIRGSHDKWLNKQLDIHERWEKNINGIYVVADHYAGRVWARSHHGSIQCYGHSHGCLQPIKNQYDVGVDNNDFYPITLEQVLERVNHNEN